MELLRKENDLLNSLIGKSFNQKSKFEAEKILDEIHSKAQSRMISKRVLCYIVDKNEIKGVGGSTLMKDKNGKIISNLILDQFGKFLTAIFPKQSTLAVIATLKDSSGIDRSMGIYDSHAQSPALFNARIGTGLGMQIQVGSGSTPPTRIDFRIETAFGTAPESIGFIAPSNPVWNSGLGNFKYTASISAGGSGTINESVCIALWEDTGNILRTFILFRDIISPAKSFIVGQTIALEYTIQL